MQKAIVYVLIGCAAIVLTGIALDEAGQGRFGGLIKSFANKATRGYGQGA